MENSGIQILKVENPNGEIQDCICDFFGYEDWIHNVFDVIRLYDDDFCSFCNEYRLFEKIYDCKIEVEYTNGDWDISIENGNKDVIYFYRVDVDTYGVMFLLVEKVYRDIDITKEKLGGYCRLVRNHYKNLKCWIRKCDNSWGMFWVF